MNVHTHTPLILLAKILQTNQRNQNNPLPPIPECVIRKLHLEPSLLHITVNTFRSKTGFSFSECVAGVRCGSICTTRTCGRSRAASCVDPHLLPYSWSDLVVTAESRLGSPRASGECPSSLLSRSNSLERGFWSSLAPTFHPLSLAPA